MDYACGTNDSKYKVFSEMCKFPYKNLACNFFLAERRKDVKNGLIELNPEFIKNTFDNLQYLM
ncbi:hypothetical protein V6C21_07290 [[Clostridium] cellulosi]